MIEILVKIIILVLITLIVGFLNIIMRKYLSLSIMRKKDEKEAKKYHDEKITNKEISMSVIKVEKIYDDFRDMTLSTKPKDIGVKNLPEKEINVFGMVMEMGYEEGIVTMVAYNTGDASMYFSEGGAFINGASRPEINAAAKEFVSFAQNFVKQAVPTASTDLPGDNAVNFYFLTNKGNFFAQEKIENLGSGGSPWTHLFKSGNRLISEINIYSKVKIKHRYVSEHKKGV